MNKELHLNWEAFQDLRPEVALLVRGMAKRVYNIEQEKEALSNIPETPNPVKLPPDNTNRILQSRIDENKKIILDIMEAHNLGAPDISRDTKEIKQHAQALQAYSNAEITIVGYESLLEKHDARRAELLDQLEANNQLSHIRAKKQRQRELENRIEEITYKEDRFNNNDYGYFVADCVSPKKEIDLVLKVCFGKPIKVNSEEWFKAMALLGQRVISDERERQRASQKAQYPNNDSPINMRDIANAAYQPVIQKQGV